MYLAEIYVPTGNLDRTLLVDTADIHHFHQILAVADIIEGELAVLVGRRHNLQRLSLAVEYLYCNKIHRLPRLLIEHGARDISFRR